MRTVLLVSVFRIPHSGSGLDLPEIYPARLLTDVDRRNRLEGREIDHLHRAGLGANALDRDKGVAVVGGHDRAVHHGALRGHAGKLPAARDLYDRHGLATLVSGDEEATVARNGE